MAPRVIHWAGLILAGCVTAALALSPAGPPEGGLAFAVAPRAANIVAGQLRRAHNLHRTLAVRDSILHQVRSADPELRVLVNVGRGIPASFREELGSALELTRTRFAWSPEGARLVVAVIADTVRPVPETTGAGYGATRAVVLPEATDGRTCLIIVGLETHGLDRLASGSVPDASLMSSVWWRESWNARYETSLLGPCAFYAAFGPPGRQVKDWLEAGDYLHAMNAWWLHGATAESPAAAAQPNRVWWRRTRRHGQFEPSLEACAAGWRDRCRDVVLSRATVMPWRYSRLDFVIGDAMSVPGVVNTGPLHRGAHHPLGLTGVNFLSDLVADVGPERFARFWQSDASVNAAFAEAVGMSVEEWTMQWARRELGPIPRGPTARPISAMLALLMAAIVAAGAAALTQRREVR